MEKSKQKLEVAKELFQKNRYEDAVSRAYYSAFHAVQALLMTEGITVKTHQGLVNLFGLHFVQSGKFDKKFGKSLTNLKDDRENSDYEIYSAIDKEDAQTAVREAEEFYEAVQKYLAEFLKNP